MGGCQSGAVGCVSLGEAQRGVVEGTETPGSLTIHCAGVEGALGDRGELSVSHCPFLEGCCGHWGGTLHPCGGRGLGQGSAPGWFVGGSVAAGEGLSGHLCGFEIWVFVPELNGSGTWPI